MLDTEFEAIITDTTKRIKGDIIWKDDQDHSPSVEFRAEIESDLDEPLFVRGSYNGLAHTLTYALIHKAYGRIYALDMGKDHHNPTCQNVGELHKHRWSQTYRDKHAYVPPDITAGIDQPVEVWQQFCQEASILHDGVMHEPPPVQMDLLL